MSTGNSQLGTVHWFDDKGVPVTSIDVEEPTFDKMQEYCGGYIEHFSVLYRGKPASMYVHEEGRRLWADRNPTATEIYFAASKARGINPDNPEQAKSDLDTMAKRLGIPTENIVHMEDPATAKPPGIYGPAILLEGFTT